MIRFLSYLVLALSLTSMLGCSSIISLGTSDPIKENPAKRSFGAYIDDEIIEVKTKVNLGNISEQLKKSHISVISYNGVVLLTGQVANEELRQLATSTAEQVKKVRRVYNEITVSGATSALARSNDAWLTAKIKSKMIANSEVAARRIKVVTENGVVFLMGLVTKAEGDRAADVVRTTKGVQKVVRIFEYI